MIKCPMYDISFELNFCELCCKSWFYIRYVLESPHMKKFFDYIQLPNFDIAADAAATFKVVIIVLAPLMFCMQPQVLYQVILLQELMTRHKSTVAEFLSDNYEWVGSPFTLNLIRK